MLDWKTPGLAVDIIGHRPGKPIEIVLIERKYEPEGWALPGGGLECGEFALAGGIRELVEETSLTANFGNRPWTKAKAALLGVYSNPLRDPRNHVVSLVYVMEVFGEPKSRSDAKDVRFWDLRDPNRPKLMFDHELILHDYLHFLRTGERPPATR